MNTAPVIVAVDGFSSCGKSTVAKSLAREMGFIYVDTGAMYRAVTLYALQNGLVGQSGIDEQGLQDRLLDIKITFVADVQAEKNETYLNGSSVEQQIRGLEVAQWVSHISKLKFVRERLVALQREMSANQSIIMDGRDIGTVVFPQADFKFFMTADPRVRAQRRFDELAAKGENPDFEAVFQNINERDYQDQNRAESPLRQADDAIVVDNSTLTRPEQLAYMRGIIERGKGK